MPDVTNLILTHTLLSRHNSTNTSQQGTSAAASAGITGGYNGDSLPLKIVIAFLLGLALYNAVELIILIFTTFLRYHGLYFISLLTATVGVIPYSTGFLLKFFKITEGESKWAAVSLITVGWYAMVTGQSVVLWSRLHLILIGRSKDEILKWTKWMIIVNFVVLHVPTTVLTYGCNGDLNVRGFVRVFQIYEKVQMVGFCLQELLLSSIYIHQTLLILRTSSAISSSTNTRKILWQLFTINVIIIAMDILLLGFEFSNLYILEACFKGVVYSCKLKLEFAVLGKLVLLVKRGRTVSNATFNGNMDGETKQGSSEAIYGSSKGNWSDRNGSSPPPMPPIPEITTDSTQKGGEVYCLENLQNTRTTTESARGAEDAVFEHYEQVVLERDGNVLERDLSEVMERNSSV